MAQKFDWDDGGIFAFARLLVLWAFFISASCFVATHGVPALARLWESIEGKPSHEGRDASWTGYLLILLLLLERIAKLSDPIKLEARKRILAPEYEKSLGFVEQFHRDFDKIVTAYLGESKRSRRRVFVFIDDLDRCEIPKAAELMQGLNLMISDSPQLVFILGIDRQKIAVALAVKHKEYLPYYPVSERFRRRQDQGDFPKRTKPPTKTERTTRIKIKVRCSTQRLGSSLGTPSWRNSFKLRFKFHE